MSGILDMSEPIPFSEPCCFFKPSNWCRCFFSMAAFTWKEKRLERNSHLAFSVFFHLVFLVCGEGAAVDHVVEGEVGDLLQAAGRHVQAHLVKSDFRGLQFVVCQLFVVICWLFIRVSQKIQKSEFWNVTYPSGFHRLDEPPEKISAL